MGLVHVSGLPFPNRVIYRAHRRFIGQMHGQIFPDYFVNLHYRALGGPFWSPAVPLMDAEPPAFEQTAE